MTDELYQTLTGRFQMSCWLDNFDLNTAAGSFSEQIVKALQAADLLVLVDSPAARASDYVRREIETARDLQKPLRRCSIDEDQPGWLRRIRIYWLALGIQMRLARGFLLAGASLFVLLAVLVAAIFILGTRVVPALANGGLRDLPAAFRPTPTATTIPAPSDPKMAAPFHFVPDTVLEQNDFNDPAFESSLNVQGFTFVYSPSDPEVTVGQFAGSLVISVPGGCLVEPRMFDCEIELRGNVLDARKVQYFGIRARTTLRTDLREVMLLLGGYDHMGGRDGFGWNFTDKALALFYSVAYLPEKDLNSVVPIDANWHAYEIVRDPATGSYYYYVDGQLMDTYTPLHANDWDNAPLQLIIYCMNGKGLHVPLDINASTKFELDQYIIGGFKG